MAMAAPVAPLLLLLQLTTVGISLQYGKLGRVSTMDLT